MSLTFQITLIGLAAGMLGTGCGGLLIVVWHQPTKRSISLLLGLASGIMLAVVGLDLIPQAVIYSNLKTTIVGVFSGLLLTHLAAVYVQQRQAVDEYIQTGILVGLGIALHNFPEGLAIGAGYAAATRLGVGLTLVIALHNFPEGLSLAAPLKVGGWPAGKILAAALISGLPMGLGAFCGASLSLLSPLLLAVNLSGAGGGMLYIVVYELLPQAYSFKYGCEATLGLLSGVVGGLVLITFL